MNACSNVRANWALMQEWIDIVLNNNKITYVISISVRDRAKLSDSLQLNYSFNRSIVIEPSFIHVFPLYIVWNTNLTEFQSLFFSLSFLRFAELSPYQSSFITITFRGRLRHSALELMKIRKRKETHELTNKRTKELIHCDNYTRKISINAARTRALRRVPNPARIYGEDLSILR